MPLDLDPLEQRLVGVLVEKEATVPESYPLTVNGLVQGANQKSNRDPEMHVQDFEVEGALKSLLVKGWVLEHEKEGGRTRRYAHQAARQLGVAKAELVLLTELLLRGPQTPTELKTRCERMAPVGGPEDVERRLRELAARPVPYVRQLERRPREHAARWMHLLGPQAVPLPRELAPTPDLAAADRAEPPVGPRPAPRAAPPPAPPPDGGLERLRDLVETLEQRVLAMEQRLDRLEGR